MTKLEDLPLPILSDILSRLPTTSSIAAARLASPELRRASRHLSAISAHCSAARRRGAAVPFRAAVANLVSLLAVTLDSISISVERPTDDVEVDDGDDCHVTAVDFLDTWLPLVAGRLSSLTIWDFWPQSCYRPSEALTFVADHCRNLFDLEVRNAWLSVNKLKPMQNLTSLTLDYIRLDDKNLDKLNECFPSLQVLNLIQVGGLLEPKINLLQLRVCTWIVSNYPHSLAICAPKLVDLKLECGEPKAFLLEAPLLSKLDLLIKKPSGVISFGKFVNLQTLSIKSSDLVSLVQLLASNKNVKQLVFETHGSSSNGYNFDDYNQMGGCTSIDITDIFPCIDELTLGPTTWSLFLKFFSLGGGRSLNQLTMYLMKNDLNANRIMQILILLLVHNTFRTVVINFPADACISDSHDLISKCSTDFPKIRWKWNTWICNDNISE